MPLIDKSLSKPIYEQIYELFRSQVLSGALEPGTRLPATRKLASELAVSRNTVDNAYQQLVMEGYVTAQPGSGHVVNSLSLVDLTPPVKAAPSGGGPLKKSLPVKYDFGSGRTFTETFPLKSWRKCVLASLDQEAMKPSYTYPSLQGEYPLRKSIRDYLLFSRGINCKAENIVVTSGLEFSLERILPLFQGRPPVVAMENPGYHSARETFLLHDCPLLPVPVDNDGIDVRQLSGTSADLLYVTPSHQFPTGSILSIQRRLMALEWAMKNDAYIIEDDYDSELRYNAKPAPPLFSLDISNRTIYLGTFSKSFTPSIRLSFMILPDALMQRYMEQYQAFHNSAPSAVQLALAHFISEGYYGRYVERLRVNNKKKNLALIEALNRTFGKKIVITGAGAGQHILADIRCGMDEAQLRAKALQSGIKLHSAAKYWFDPSDAPKHLIMMGYGGISPADIPPAVRLLYQVCFPDDGPN